MRRAALALMALALAACSGSSGPDWDGYAAYLSAEVRPTPITGSELAALDPSVTCEIVVSLTRWGLAASYSDAESQTAHDYFLCGSDFARSVVHAATDGDAEIELLSFIDEELPTYGN